MSHRLLGASLTLLALAWLWLVDNYIPEVPTEGEPGPRALPFLLGIILAILGVALAVGRVPPRTDIEPQAEPPTAGRHELRIALATFAMLVAYAFLLDKLGFLLSAITLMAFAMAGILGMRRWLFIAGFAAAFSLACWVVFNVLLGIPLPR